MEGVITPIFIYMGDRKQRGTGVIRDIDFANIKAVCDGIIPCLISGMPDQRIINVTLRDITVEHQGGENIMTKPLQENTSGYPENRMFGRKNPAGALYIRHADNIKVVNFRAHQRELDHRPVVVASDVNGLKINELNATSTDGVKVQTTGSKEIYIDNNAI